MSHAEREHKAHAPPSVRFAIVTVSDSRDLYHDESGGLLADLAQQAGHTVARRTLVRDEPDEIRAALREALTSGADVLVFTGGTGIARRDVTVETVAPRFGKRLDGFGELFRMLSHQSLGSAAMASRADAGVIAERLVFLLPGSPDACRLAMERLILPEVGHLVGLLRR
ncbi:MAG TPA: molybdenum cofactor biosynthesis protein B [Candidatus Thermoplasmatota archaeon]|nr:molybdenum cofactor biosynthesis protein B [Candidatus Thermoplasmatota archaeon]